MTRKKSSLFFRKNTNSTLLHFVFLALKGQRGTDSGFNRWEQAPRGPRPEGAEDDAPPPLQGVSVAGRVPGDDEN